MIVNSGSMCYTKQVGNINSTVEGSKVTGNTELMARNAVVDGIKLRYIYRGYDESQRRYNSIMRMLEDASGWSDEAVRNYVKFAKVKSGKRGGPEYDSYFIGGKLARKIPANWLDEQLNAVVEVQVKWYLVEGDRRGLEAFNDAVWSAAGGKFRPAWYGAQGGRGRSEPGSRGLSFSTGKADVHVGIRKYRGERPAVEGHVKDKVLRTIVNDVQDREERHNAVGSTAKPFQEVQYQAAVRAARRFLRAVRSRGIVLTDYFQGVSYVSWVNPLHEKGFDLLDENEERAAAEAAKITGVYLSEDGQFTMELE